MATIFTRIINGEIPSYKISENEKFVAFLDAFPIKRGHTLVVPRKEVDNYFDLAPEDIADMQIFVQRIAKAIEKAFPCRKVGMTILGLEVPHAHIHLVPMETEKDMLFSNPKLSFSDEEMKEIARKIKEQL